jgi:hypothetical protein
MAQEVLKCRRRFGKRQEHSSLSAMASHFIIYIVSLVVHKDVDHLKIKLDLKKQ